MPLRYTLPSHTAFLSPAGVEVYDIFPPLSLIQPPVQLLAHDSDTGKWSLIFKNDSTHLPPELSTLRKSKWNQYDEAKK